MNHDVIIVGGGLAGLTASICLSKQGLSTLILEKNKYPHHKVCGEYISNEVRPFLESLGLDLTELGAVPIDTFSISNQKGKRLRCKLPLGGFGISRYTLDNALYQLALGLGVGISFETVSSIRYVDGQFFVQGKENEYTGSMVIGAFGKRSVLDKSMDRTFMQTKSPWLGVKGHFRYANHPENEVSLHCFPGGYGGLSMTEDGLINFCYLASYKVFQQYEGIDGFNDRVVSKNPFLKKFMETAEPIFKNPLSIAQISFAKKELVHDHVLMCGDSAGLIHPLCGNGMAMAIHSGKIASDVTLRYFNEKGYSRTKMEDDYTKLWKSNFDSRLYYGRKLQNLITNPLMVNGIFSIIPNSGTFLSAIIKRTHGKPILV
ncbi:NAD(P)/FAD-dependent oxidoreductase [Flagellimonas meishanensis]|uniref:NAD(P)/FAD-dependent oxidoreductase n=1 Tax=Flagellimonas meishanensis TaxID=2873264 RepID=UPI00223BD9E5|nr:NAD(P)/FAD-dependent oxidoreductase [[Muricauda] meishanensis]